MAVTSVLMLSGDFTFPSSGHVSHALQPAPAMVAQLGVSNSRSSSVSHLAIVHRLCLSRGIRRVSVRDFVRDLTSVLHERGAKDGEVPERVVVVRAAVTQGLTVEAALLEDGKWIDEEIFVLVDAELPGVVSRARTAGPLLKLSRSAASRTTVEPAAAQR